MVAVWGVSDWGGGGELVGSGWGTIGLGLSLDERREGSIVIDFEGLSLEDSRWVLPLSGLEGIGAGENLGDFRRCTSWY